MNFIDPIPNAEFQFSIVCALLCVMFIILYVGVKLTNRIEELRGDMLNEDAQVYNHLNASEQGLLRHISNINESVCLINQTLNRPLYEVGNTIWFNDGANGKPGVYEDIKGKILVVNGDGKSEPFYLVKHTLGEELIIQSLIVAWTN